MAEKLTGGKASILSESCPPGPVSCGPFSGPMAGDWYPLSSVNVPGWAEKALRVLLWTGMTAAFSKVFCSEFFFFFLALDFSLEECTRPRDEGKWNPGNKSPHM